MPVWVVWTRLNSRPRETSSPPSRRSSPNWFVHIFCIYPYQVKSQHLSSMFHFCMTLLCMFCVSGTLLFCKTYILCKCYVVESICSLNFCIILLCKTLVLRFRCIVVMCSEPMYCAIMQKYMYSERMYCVVLQRRMYSECLYRSVLQKYMRSGCLYCVVLQNYTYAEGLYCVVLQKYMYAERKRSCDEQTRKLEQELEQYKEADKELIRQSIALKVCSCAMTSFILIATVYSHIICDSIL